MSILTQRALDDFVNALPLVKVKDGADQKVLDGWRKKGSEWQSEAKRDKEKIHEHVAAPKIETEFKELLETLESGKEVNDLKSNLRKLKAVKKIEDSPLPEDIVNKLKDLRALVNDVKLETGAWARGWNDSHNDFIKKIERAIANPKLGALKDLIHQLETTQTKQWMGGREAYNIEEFIKKVAGKDKENLQKAWNDLKATIDAEYQKQCQQAGIKSTTLQGADGGKISLVEYLREEQAQKWVESKDEKGAPKVNDKGELIFTVDNETFRVIDNKGNDIIRCENNPASFEKAAQAFKDAGYSAVIISADEKNLPALREACRKAGLKIEKENILEKPKEKEADKGDNQKDTEKKNTASGRAGPSR